MTDREAIDVLFNEWKCIDRNDGIHCDRKCESCDLVMDVGIIREAFNMAISALESQEAKHSIESSLTQKALDTISRQAAIDAVHKAGITEYDETLAIEEIERVPSAQPETPMQIGWICPVCGRGLSPLTSVCPCNNGKGWEITC